MKVTIKSTGQDITHLYLKLLSGEITNKEFEKLTGLKNNKNEEK